MYYRRGVQYVEASIYKPTVGEALIASRIERESSVARQDPPLLETTYGALSVHNKLSYLSCGNYSNCRLVTAKLEEKEPT